MQRLSLIFLEFLAALFAVVPFRLLYFFSDGLAWLFLHIIKYRSKILQQNLRKAFPEKSPAEIAALQRQFYRHFSDVLLESIKGLTLQRDELQRRFRYRNPGIFDDLLAQGKSAILLGSHVGNWEWGSLSLPLAVEHQVVGIYKPLKNPVADAWLNRRRMRWGLQLASMAQAGRAVIEGRNKPCIFVLIADQTPVDVKNAHWLTFLNQDTPFLHGADKLARQTGYPVFFVEIQRVARGFYEVSFSELCREPGKTEEGTVTKLFAERLEKHIQREPANWLWSHRRWKRARR
ncbi:MAG: lysophospholipid acyltransferase family protein [Bacteroidota bacterium]